MIRYYTNRDLAQKLEINLARWKRWSRSFLPPDPLGGMQSGYARQYLFKDLFKVFLGGFLLGHLKLSVVESQQLLNDISPWLEKNGYFDWNHSNGSVKTVAPRPNTQMIYFCPTTGNGTEGGVAFRYLIRETLQRTEDADNPDRRTSITYEETFIPSASVESIHPVDHPHVRIINLTALFNQVVQKLAQPDTAK